MNLNNYDSNQSKLLKLIFCKLSSWGVHKKPSTLLWQRPVYYESPLVVTQVWKRDVFIVKSPNTRRVHSTLNIVFSPKIRRTYIKTQISRRRSVWWSRTSTTRSTLDWATPKLGLTHTFWGWGVTPFYPPIKLGIRYLCSKFQVEQDHAHSNRFVPTGHRGVVTISSSYFFSISISRIVININCSYPLRTRDDFLVHTSGSRIIKTKS